MSVAHYGSAASEIAVCLKAVGLVERDELRLLELTGAEVFLHHALAAAVPGEPPSVGEAFCVAETWCCRLGPDRAIVAGAADAVERWRQVVSRAVAGSGTPVAAGLLRDAVAVSIVGPRAGAVLTAALLPADLSPGGVTPASLAGSALAVVREDGDRFLLLFTEGCSRAARRTIEEHGRAAGLARVGHDALGYLRAARRN